MRTTFRLVLLFLSLIFLAQVVAAQGRGEKFVGTTWQGVVYPQFGMLFTQLTPENAGKWGEAEPAKGVFNWSSLDAMFSLAAERHLIIKEHNLLWREQQPSWVTERNAEPAVRRWFSALSARYGDKIAMIDVVNEPLDGAPSYASGLPGGDSSYGWVVWAYELARKDFPHAKLLVNEYGILGSAIKTEEYVGLIRTLKRRGLVDGIGCEAHGLEYTPVSTIRANLGRLQKLGLPVYISEWDLDYASSAAQLAEMKKLFPLFWEDPHVRGITFWDFVQGQMWKHNAYLVRSDGTERPALKWLVDYLKRHPAR